MVKINNMLYYLVRWNSQTPASHFDSHRVKVDFPDLLLRFFEKLVLWVAPQFIQPLGNVIAEGRGEVDGEPVNISCKTFQLFIVYIWNNSKISINFRCHRFTCKWRIVIFGRLCQRQSWTGHINWNHWTRSPKLRKWFLWKSREIQLKIWVS